MHYLCSVHCRPIVGKSLDELHQQFLAVFDRDAVRKVLPLDVTKVGKFNSREKYDDHSCSLTRALPGRISGHLWFRNRRELEDAARCDDSLNLSFNPTKVDLPKWVDELFPALVEALNPYSAYIENWDASGQEWAAGPWETRNQVEFLGNVTFADAELIRRAFVITPDQLLEQLKSAGVECYKYCGGVVIVVSRLPLEEQAARTESARILGPLKKEGSPIRQMRAKDKSPKVSNRAEASEGPHMKNVNAIFGEFAGAFVGTISDGQEIAFPDKLSRATLDGSPDSLRHVDEYLAHVYKKQNDLSQQDWTLTVLRAGAYVGEVIRNSAPPGAFQWVDYDDYVASHPEFKQLVPERTTATCAFLVQRSGKMTMPLNKIAQFIAEGSENSVHFFAACDLRDAK